jgi:hypothetical protein
MSASGKTATEVHLASFGPPKAVVRWLTSLLTLVGIR